MSFSLNFSSAPVSSDVIAAVLAERAQQAEKERALKYASDMERCQRVVDECKKHLRELRKAETAFLNEFKKLETPTNAPSFAEAYNSSPLLRRIAGGTLFLEADYEE